MLLRFVSITYTVHIVQLFTKLQYKHLNASLSAFYILFIYWMTGIKTASVGTKILIVSIKFKYITTAPVSITFVYLIYLFVIYF